MIYLDYQATTPLAPEALDAMLPWLRDQHANPHSSHAPGRAAQAAVEVARERVAALLPPGGSLAFTSGATEALNWAIKGTRGPIVTIANPLDYHTFIWGDTPRMTDVFSAVLRDRFDLAVFVLDIPRDDRCDPAGYQCAIDAIIAASIDNI